MNLPKSVTKISKNGVEFISSVDQANYTIEELTKAALRDVGKYLKKESKKLIPVWTGTLKKCCSTWVYKPKTTDEPVKLQIGIYSNEKARKKGLTPAYHAHLVLFGYHHVDGNDVPGNNFLEDPALANLDMIQKIESQYLSALSEDTIPEDMIDEDFEGEDED